MHQTLYIILVHSFTYLGPSSVSINILRLVMVQLRIQSCKLSADIFQYEWQSIRSPRRRLGWDGHCRHRCPDRSSGIILIAIATALLSFLALRSCLTFRGVSGRQSACMLIPMDQLCTTAFPASSDFVKFKSFCLCLRALSRDVSPQPPRSDVQLISLEYAGGNFTLVVQFQKSIRRPPPSPIPIQTHRTL